MAQPNIIGQAIDTVLDALAAERQIRKAAGSKRHPIALEIAREAAASFSGSTFSSYEGAQEELERVILSALERHEASMIEASRVNEEHRQRMILCLEATAARFHPEYGPCDSLSGGACSECERRINAAKEITP